MPLTRSRSQSASSSQPAHLFSGFQQWRRRRMSNSVPTSPLATSSSATTTELSRSSSQHSDPPNQLYHQQKGEDPIDNETVTHTLSPEEASSQHNLHIRLLPNIGMNARCFVFDIIDRVLTPTTVLKIGRYSERHSAHERVSFKSKVVSRSHAELWMDKDKKIFIRDVGSSSGTFVNRLRLSESNEISSSFELKDGDIIQLGVDYQGGQEQVFRSVKIRLEINRNPTKKSNLYSRQAFQQLRQHLLTSTLDEQSMEGTNTLKDCGSLKKLTTATIQECCICLYAIAPLQALFVAPCSHVFHFKCLRPIVFQHYPGFSCPLCRNYYDLEASVAIEVSEVAEAMERADNETPPQQDQQQHRQQQQQQHLARPDGFLFSSTLVDPSMLDQEGGYGNLPSSL